MLTLANRLLMAGGGKPLAYVGAIGDFTSGDPVTATFSGSFSGGVDTALEEGDLVVVMWGLNEAQGGFSVTSSGWTYAGSEAKGNVTLAVAYKIMGATPDTSCTLNIGNSANCNYLVAAFRNVDQSDPDDSVTPLSADGSGDRPDPPAITVNTDGALVLAMGASNGGGGNTAFTAPSGYTNMTEQGGAFQKTGFCFKQVSAAGSENPGSFRASAGTGDWSAWTMAILPATPSGAIVTS